MDTKKKRQNKDRKIQIRITKENEALLNYISARDGVSKSEIVRKSIEMYNEFCENRGEK